MFLLHRRQLSLQNVCGGSCQIDFSYNTKGRLKRAWHLQTIICPCATDINSTGRRRVLDEALPVRKIGNMYLFKSKLRFREHYYNTCFSSFTSLRFGKILCSTRCSTLSAIAVTAASLRRLYLESPNRDSIYWTTCGEVMRTPK